MSDVFQSAAEDFLKSESNQSAAPSPEPTTDSATEPQDKQSFDQAILDLEKAEKFSFGGREWTRDSLKALIDQEKKFQSMDKDYTTKMQKISAEKKTFDEKQTFFKNLHWDLPKLVSNPSLITEFMTKYPPEFHQLAAEYLRENQPKESDQTKGVQSQPRADVELMMKVHALEKANQEREIKTHEQEITNIRNDLNQKYQNVSPPAAQKMILAEAFEMLEANRQEDPSFVLTREHWEQIYKQVSNEIASISKAEYGSLVKKQTEANAKARDVGAGGGTAGPAPIKFKKFDDLQKHAESLAKGS